MRTLADYFDDKSLRAVGRLDADSEGLLLLTDDGKLNHAIATPDQSAHKHGKTYLVQVENVPTQLQLQQLRQGVDLKDGKTLPAQVQVLEEAELPIVLWQRTPPIRERKSVPTAWLALTIFEGKNRQVRRMTAHVGLPCLRLIRHRIAGFELGGLGVGESKLFTPSIEELKEFGIYYPLKSSKPVTHSKPFIPKNRRMADKSKK